MATSESTLSPSGSTVEPTSAKLPLGALLAFTVAGFLAIVTETSPAGLLPQISDGLGVSEGVAGQLLTAYALGSVVAAIPIITATRGWRRRPLLLWAIGTLMVTNAICAASPSITVTLVFRFAAGMAAGVVWGLLAGYARRMVAASIQGRALAIVGVGQPIALSLGVPLGSWLGSIAGWRADFWAMSAVALGLMVWIRTAVPDAPGEPAESRAPLAAVLVTPGVRPVLVVIFAWILAHNVLYTYIAPFVDERGMKGSVPLVLLVFGVSAVLGVTGTGVVVDSRLRHATLISLAGFAIATAVLALGLHIAAVTYLAVALWGLTFGGAPTLLQTAIADAGGNSADVAQSMLVTVFNLAVAGGGALGGVLIGWSGPESLPWAPLLLALAAFVVVHRCRKHAFRPGHRTAN